MKNSTLILRCCMDTVLGKTGRDNNPFPQIELRPLYVSRQWALIGVSKGTKTFLSILKMSE